MDLKEAMATNVRLARHERKLTQEELADRAGLSARYLGSIERASVSASVTVNAGGILQRQAGVIVQHGRKQEGPRYRGPSCLSRFIPEGQPPTAVLPVLGVTGAWSERA